MNEHDSFWVNVGDIIYEKREHDDGLSIVVGLEPTVQAANILAETGAQKGLVLGAAGSVIPKDVYGSLPIEDIADSMVASQAVYSILGYEFVLNSIQAAAGKGPKRFNLPDTS